MWTEQHQSVLEAFEKRFALPPNDDSAGDWTNRLAQQFKFSFPSEGWGTKQASSTRPPSTDVICTRSPFVGYDVIVDQGRPTQKLANMPGEINLVGQVFIDVAPHDYVGSSVINPPVTPPSSGIDIMELMTKLNGIESKLTILDKRMETLVNNMILLSNTTGDKVGGLVKYMADIKERNEQLHQLTQSAVVGQAQAVIEALR
jgi:hypothetical protein